MSVFTQKQIKSFLTKTIKLAEKALKEGNYPIGSVIVNSGGEIVAGCRNENFTKDDITAHAEVLCLRKLGIKKLAKDSINKFYLFSSLEHCCGCGFFIARTNIKAVYVAALDPFRPGISAAKVKKPFSDVFSNMEFVVCKFPDLAYKSKLLMRDYFIKKGRPEAAKIYDN